MPGSMVRASLSRTSLNESRIRGRNHGRTCAAGRICLALLRFFRGYAPEVGLSGLKEIRWRPNSDWPMFGMLHRLQSELQKESNGFVSTCDQRDSTSLAPLRDALIAEDSAAATPHAAYIVLDMNRSSICPLGLATAHFAIAASKRGAGHGESLEVAQWLHRGEKLVKDWWRGAKHSHLHELLATRWPLWKFLARMEASSSIRSGIIAPACPRGARHLLNIGLETTRVEAVVVFGRESRLRILHRYLWRNLRVNGGVVDRVNFVVFHAKRKDLFFLDELVRQHAPYYAMPAAHGRRLAKIYSVCKRPNTVYVKIDDDITYISDATIPSIVREKLRKRCVFVSANVVNHAIISPIHQEIGALRTFLPPEEGLVYRNWRRQPNLSSDVSQAAWRRADGRAPAFVIEKKAQSDCVWARWECAAWMHESLLSRLADDSACAYDFGWYNFHAQGHGTRRGAGSSGDATSTANFVPLAASRWSINFFAFEAEDLLHAEPESLAEDDEAELSYLVPHRLGKQACAVGRALVAHYSYSRQDAVLSAQTDILDRYDRLSSTLTQQPWSI
eukprot:TRINITY_DN56056_c0_g1_i1.p1 TRINITY_DN56056_c0_g1~~TRINITY_DN56056_c0_g1_i1.p1  ORF type:complete len:560 (-),score=67.15 TRINITY_DN56056_c0_g1_i1:123-1802(-)